MSTLEDKIAALETRIANLEKPGIDQGQFRLLFTFAERQAEEVFRQKAQETVKGAIPEPVDPLAPTPEETEALPDVWGPRGGSFPNSPPSPTYAAY